MDLDHDACYRAIELRDARFDGRFFTAVKTTRTYCRPVCPARTPRSENVTFYPTAAAAQEAGSARAYGVGRRQHLTRAPGGERRARCPERLR